MTEETSKPVLSWRNIPSLKASSSCTPFETTDHEPPWRKNTQLGFHGGGRGRGSGSRRACNFACVSVVEKGEQKEFAPSPAQLVKHPLAILALVPKDAALFAAGAIAGAAAKTVTAPLDRIKLLMQTHGVRVGQESAKKAIGFIEAITMIGKEEGIKGYWKGNLPQVIRIIPYSAVQLFAYETYKITYPLDVLRLRLAVEPGYRTMSEIALNMLREEGVAAFYYGLGPSLIGIAPYIAVNFCVFDLVKKALPENFQKKAEASLVTALVSASLATLTCYPLDTVRRQMQMKGTPYKTVLDAFTGNIRLTTYDFVKRLIVASEKEIQKIMEENRDKQHQSASG
ncbi:putative envelope ADP,ATP carrier protein [Morus notabilis]|uniref:Putative envelope ADP,ATP carrier protein n=1 Tax=Morus notabilis TaxID=981085 RepID=W9S2U6_9ROSA|nr:putative envelope ADP,ATP carrier protein [Morus notabilis]